MLVFIDFYCLPTDKEYVRHINRIIHEAAFRDLKTIDSTSAYNLIKTLMRQHHNNGLEQNIVLLRRLNQMGGGANLFEQIFDAPVCNLYPTVQDAIDSGNYDKLSKFHKVQL